MAKKKLLQGSSRGCSLKGAGLKPKEGPTKWEVSLAKKKLLQGSSRGCSLKGAGLKPKEVGLKSKRWGRE
ncbi:MAG: hypothetical protein IKH94_05030 [Eubacterium sp.]|nr:hypothetical protein [Eubacterium sp.]